MTEKLTIKDLNCANCPDHSENKYMDFCGGRPMARDDPTEIIEFIRIHGCALHPLALQVLAAPIIEELGKEEKEQIEIYQNATTKNEEVYHQGIVFGIQMAIKLLKEGVKKP